LTDTIASRSDLTSDPPSVDTETRHSSPYVKHGGESGGTGVFGESKHGESGETDQFNEGDSRENARHEGEGQLAVGSKPEIGEFRGNVRRGGDGQPAEDGELSGGVESWEDARPEGHGQSVGNGRAQGSESDGEGARSGELNGTVGVSDDKISATEVAMDSDSPTIVAGSLSRPATAERAIPAQSDPNAGSDDSTPTTATRPR
jgi:hypothetical protein